MKSARTRPTSIALATGAMCMFAGAALAQPSSDADKPEQPEKKQPGKKQQPDKKQPGQNVVRIGIETDAPYGQYLVDAKGKTLYMFTADGAGASNCYDACARAWPPVLTTGAPSLAAGTMGDGLDADKLGTVTRRDGKRQVTYAGSPLYYFQRDTPTNEISGQHVESFGGEWYLVAPTGEAIKTTVGEDPEKKGMHDDVHDDMHDDMHEGMHPKDREDDTSAPPRNPDK